MWVFIILLNLFLLSACFFLIIYNIKNKRKLNIVTCELENAKNQNKYLNILYDNIRGFKHDFDNMINIMDGFIEANDIKGLKSYYSELKGERTKTQNIEKLNSSIINNPGIYNLIISEYDKAKNFDINMNFDFFFDFNNLYMSVYEFSKILGILLDNAIDAAKEADKKEICLICRFSKKDNAQIISITNTYNNKNIDIQKIFEKGISSKKQHSGIGLWEVKKIVNKHDNVILHTTKDDNVFTQQLEIYNFKK